jgi:hypothetical protein
MTRTSRHLASQTHSRQSLENSVEQIEQLLATARRVASEMGRLKIGELLIANQPSFNCAMTDLSRWDRACREALTAKLIEIGYFKAEMGRKEIA